MPVRKCWKCGKTFHCDPTENCGGDCYFDKSNICVCLTCEPMRDITSVTV